MAAQGGRYFTDLTEDFEKNFAESFRPPARIRERFPGFERAAVSLGSCFHVGAAQLRHRRPRVRSRHARGPTLWCARRESFH